MKQAPERESERKACPAAGDETESEEIAEYFAENCKSAENDNGLGSVKADIGTLVNEEEDKPRYPTKRIAEGASHIFLKARSGATTSVARILPRLRCAACRTKRNVLSHSRSAFCAVC